MDTVIIGWGCGPVPKANARSAVANMKALVRDVGISGVIIYRNAKEDSGDGRYEFTLMYRLKKIPVSMPGLRLERVRYTDHKKQNILEYPRLYIDGNSYVWMYAVEVLQELLEESES